MKKSILVIMIMVMGLGTLSSKEGMWLPMLLKSLNEADMQSMGLKLSAKDIYSINQSSLKDAVISFGGFCTGEIISNEGLILTNHHCGYGQVQKHSSVENDYLTNGYWAMNKKAELPNPGLTATFIVRMEDVTEAVLGGLSTELSEAVRQDSIGKRIKKICAEAGKEKHYQAFIKPFFYGNEYYMFITETFPDVRLVGAPPSAIGKFGGDTDNWMWPRHTGDFSLFRIYANKDNMPAAYSEDNVPYMPRNYLPISMKGVEKGDFTMVFGFPGRTQEYLTSHAIRQIKEVINPKQIEIRREALDILDRNMKADDKVRIQYASKYASVSNYWKKWIGENNGLEKTNAIALKEKQEKEFIEATKGKPEYNGLVEQLKIRYDALEKYALARTYFIEIPYRQIELFKLAYSFTGAIEMAKEGKEIDAETSKALLKKTEAHFKDYDYVTDLELAVQLLGKYEKESPVEFTPRFFVRTKGSYDVFFLSLYKKSIFNKETELIEMLADGLSAKEAMKLKGDLAFNYISSFYKIYRNKIQPEYNRLNQEIDSLSKIYVKGLRLYVPGVYYPDANSTLRLAYGKVDSYEPRDGVDYEFFTSTTGILEKYNPEDVDFDLPERLITLIKDKDFGPYQDKDGSMHVCFTASNHTTGGNSGSPVINGSGELIGLNFDRNWEGTMSDINYDVNQCRNIAVDIRYVLFIVDKYAGASHLIKEMKLVN